MKFNYTHILLCSLSLNILLLSSQLYNKRNHNSATYHTSNTKSTKTHRTLCECELYAPSNYENNPEMKELMENFNRQTSERFRKYDEGVQDKRKQCKEQCEKDIQKIILKDKIGKQIAEQFSALETNIETNDIPTCLCEKSLVDKTENFCLKCGYGLGGVVAPSIGLLGGMGMYGWKIAVLEAAKDAAIAEGTAAGTKAGVEFGIKFIMSELKRQLGVYSIASSSLHKYVTAQTLKNPTLLIKSIKNHYVTLCNLSHFNNEEVLCSAAGENYIDAMSFIDISINNILEDAKGGADTLAAHVTNETILELTETKTSMVQASSVTYNTAIIASVVAILIIVLVMVIIYLILRYRRKNKMKKKLQYIKILKE
ncbi:PIR protein, putative [Plasmodium sp.]|nr:PIR protein, putative [Plasmodium sp.]